MDFVQKVALFNQIAGNDNQFNARKVALYTGLIAEEFSELLVSIPYDNQSDGGFLQQAIATITILSDRMKNGQYDELIEKINRVDAVDAHIDIAVVALGGAYVTGTDLNGACHNVADSNLSKFPVVDGKRVVLKNSSGKVIKPDSYTPADVAQFIK